MQLLKFALCALFIGLAASQFPPPPPPLCPPGWVILPNSFTCYLLVPTPVVWDAAKAICPTLLPNSQLVVIDNGPELQLVTGLVPGGQIWVGDEISSFPNPRQCVKAILQAGVQKLIAVPCGILLPYVCELDISPNPCHILPPNAPTALTYFPHPALPYKFIQCTLLGQAFVKLCAKGTIWNQAWLTCVSPPPPLPGRRRRAAHRRVKAHKKHRNQRDIYGQDQGYDDGSFEDYVDDDTSGDYQSPLEEPPRKKYDKLSPYRLSAVYKAPGSYHVPDDYYQSVFYRTLYPIEGVDQHYDNDYQPYDYQPHGYKHRKHHYPTHKPLVEPYPLGYPYEYKHPKTYKPTAPPTSPQETTPQETTPQETTPQRTTPQETTPRRTTPQRTTPQRTTPPPQ